VVAMRPETMSHTCCFESTGGVQFVSVDEASNHEIRHVLRLGEAQRVADEALDPGPQIAVCALDLLRVLLAHLRLLGIAMPDRVSNVHFTLDIPCEGLLLTESQRGSCLALPPLSEAIRKLSPCCSEIKQPAYGNETQDDRRDRAC